MGLTKGADTFATLVTTKVMVATVFPKKTVVEGLPVGARSLELNVVLNFLGNGGWIFTK